MDLELLRANLVRTVVPLIVGAVFSLLPFLDGRDELATLTGFMVSAVYYTVFRVAETRFPWLGVFLGRRLVVPGRPAGHARVTGSDVTSLHQPTPDGEGELIRLMSAGQGTQPGVHVAGRWLRGVDSVSWTSRAGEPSFLNVRLRDVVLQSTDLAPVPLRPATVMEGDDRG